MVPSDWKDANVISIHKSGTKSTATNYRPIRLTSQLCKVFETIVRDQVVKYLENNSLIRDSQHGFRKGGSTLTNLLMFLDKVINSVDEGLSVDVIFLDLAKAFDKVPRQRLLEKCKKTWYWRQVVGSDRKLVTKQKAEGMYQGERIKLDHCLAASYRAPYRDFYFFDIYE